MSLPQGKSCRSSYLVPLNLRFPPTPVTIRVAIHTVSANLNVLQNVISNILYLFVVIIRMVKLIFIIAYNNCVK